MEGPGCAREFCAGHHRLTAENQTPMRRCIVLLVILASFPSFAWAQAVAPSPVSPTACRAAGLERAWFTQLGLDRGRGRLAGICMHVSAIQSHTVFEFSHDG